MTETSYPCLRDVHLLIREVKEDDRVYIHAIDTRSEVRLREREDARGCWVNGCMTNHDMAEILELVEFARKRREGNREDPIIGIIPNGDYPGE